MSRLTLDPKPGQVFLIESNSQLMLRKCAPPDDKKKIHRFTKHAEDANDGLVTIPFGKQTSNDDFQGRPTLTGRLVWQIHAPRS